jgi:DNA-nicking Smr family endonuclease
MGKAGEEDALWSRIAETVKPLAKKQQRVARPAAKPSKVPKPEPSPKPGRAAKPMPPPAPPKAPPVPLPSEAELDRRQARALEKGKLAVEARIDLHGMRQREAHTALRRFLKSAQNDGLRHVLVITGKGTERSAPRSFYEEETRGVLRQQVPHWLAQPDLASVVISFSEAPRRLGGGGALYVRLKRVRG